MQVRKLIRLLSEAVEKNPKVAYMDACVDNRYGANNVDNYTFSPICDAEIRNTIWNQEETINECQRDIMVLGNY